MGWSKHPGPDQRVAALNSDLSGCDFSALYRTHVSSVYAYFYHQVSSIQDAEDLTATTFSKALAGCHGYRSQRASVTAWLFGIARNCPRDHRRRNRRSEPLHPDLPDSQPLPETLWLSAGRTLALQRAIQRLPLDQRDALALRFFGGLGVRDVAEILGKSDGAVKMLVRRAVLAPGESSEREDWR